MTIIDTIVEWSRPFDDASKAGIDYRPAAMPDGVLDPACRVGATEGRPPVRFESISPRREATCRP